MLSIDKLSRVPIYEQVIEQVEMKIRLGDFAEGELLPSVRALSVALEVNPNTLQKAYAELERRGLCRSTPGNGRFVSVGARAVIAHGMREKLRAFGMLAAQLHSEGATMKELHGAVEEAAGVGAKGRTTDD
ncbi:MAG: GntR family transcriptional regulator [Oscillospiraceae bacterium]|nr:GntR family transcriptional regulator [Oscillospiraceae bacterium]